MTCKTTKYQKSRQLSKMEESIDDVSTADLDDPDNNEIRELCKVDFATVK
jgi:hypothetical protein